MSKTAVGLMYGVGTTGQRPRSRLPQGPATTRTTLASTPKLSRRFSAGSAESSVSPGHHTPDLGMSGSQGD